MTIRTRLYICLLVIVALPGLMSGFFNTRSSELTLKRNIGYRVQSMALQGANAIKAVFTERISEAMGLSQSEQIILAVRESNALLKGLGSEGAQAYIYRVDQAWINDRKKSDRAREIQSSEVSDYLRRYAGTTPGKYGEIFITNQYGTTVASTKVLSDYYQADETWWEKSYAEGNGDIFIDDRGYDQSVKSLVTGIVVPIRDQGKTIGVLKINFKINHVLNLIATKDIDDLAYVSIARSTGSMIVSSDQDHASLSEGEMHAMKSGQESGWKKDHHHDGDMIMGYAPVDLPVNARVPTPGEKKGISGEVWKPVSWYVFVDVSKEKVLMPVKALTKQHYLLLGGVMLFAGLIATLLARSIVRPIRILQKGAGKIQAGNLDHEIALNTPDEMGKLARALNTMARSLINTNTSLEEMVADRTRQLQTRNEQLKQSNEDLQQFAYVASHDLQEPLRMVASYTQLLSERYNDKLDEKANKYIYYAVDGASRMQRLIQDLLSFSRVSTHGRDFEQVPLASIVESMLKQMTVIIRDTGARIIVEDLPEVKADPSQISQVFQNLISNSLKFCTRERPEIIVSVQKEDSFWRFSVTDNGIGIESEYKDKIFIIFQRLHTRKEYAGTGIGLAICKRIINRHGGRIWFESTLGKGTVFYFTLPV